MTPLSLYIHIPFCKAKCSYCSFVSSPESENTINSYIQCLIKEIAMNKSKLQEFGVDTIFIGGGTPSTLDPKQLTKLLTAINDNIRIVHPLEYTFECNPDSLTLEKLQVLKKFGINRLSIGLQTVNSSELKTLGRIHSYEQFINAYNIARELGFTNISVDLMFAFPNQTLTSFENSLNLVTDLKPDHISCYSLIVEDDTLLSLLIQEQKLSELTEDEYINMYRYSIEFLKEKGYQQYEISNYAKENYESRHNIGYWTHKNYLGLGLAAHSFIQGVRFSNTECLSTYIAALNTLNSPIEYSEKIEQSDLFDETIMLEIRMNKGINISTLKEKFGNVENLDQKIHKLKEKKLLENTSEYIKLTQKGRELCNTVILELVK